MKSCLPICLVSFLACSNNTPTSSEVKATIVSTATTVETNTGVIVPPTTPVSSENTKQNTFAVIMSKQTLNEAIEAVKPIMTDETNSLSEGAIALALWGNEKMKWKDLQEIPSSKFSLVQKDSDEERGKKICTSGSIVEISAEKTEMGKFYSGGLYGSDGNIYRFLAVGTSGDLVGRSQAKLCGIVIGKQDYSGSNSNTVHAVFLVGMFDLPGNKK